MVPRHQSPVCKFPPADHHMHNPEKLALSPCLKVRQKSVDVFPLQRKNCKKCFLCKERTELELSEAETYHGTGLTGEGSSQVTEMNHQQPEARKGGS